MRLKTHRLRVSAALNPENLKLTTYAAGFTDPSVMISLSQNGVTDGFADYTVTLDEPASARSHFIVDTSERSASAPGGFVSMSFVSATANIPLSVLYPDGMTAAPPTWRVAGQADQVTHDFALSNPNGAPVTIELLLPVNVNGASLLAENAGIVHWFQSDVSTQLVSVDFSDNALNQESIDRLIAWAAEPVASVGAMNLTGADMSPPSSASCTAMDALANRAVNLDHQPMTEPCPAYIQTTVNAAGVLVCNVAGLDWPVMDGTTLAINAAGELVATGDAADKLSINAEGELLISAPLEELATA